MERIVLGYDGSPAAMSALNWTAARAAAGGMKVDVVLVVSPFTKDHAPAWRRLDEAVALLRERLPDLEVELNLEVELHGLEGQLTESIANAAREADLVVIGINPGRPVRAAAAGWLPLRLSTRATAPVCMIPVGWTQGDDPVTVGVATDDSSASALNFGAAEAIRTSTDLRLVHSWLMPTPSFDDGAMMSATPEAVIEDRRHLLHGAAERLIDEHPDLRVTSELIRDSRSAALLQFDGRSSLMVIGSHRRGVLISSLLGSVGQEILWRAECPICIVPPDAATTAAPPMVRARAPADPGGVMPAGARREASGDG